VLPAPTSRLCFAKTHLPTMKTQRLVRLAAFTLMLAVGAALAPAATLTLTVTDAGDSGPGTLRQAILDANADSSPDPVAIQFNIPGGGVQTIAPLTGLPIVTRPVTIDGYTQSGASPNTLSDADNAVLLIELSGASLDPLTDGLVLFANDCTVRGLAINRFLRQIRIEDATNAVVEGNFLGTDVAGTNALTNSEAVFIRNGQGHRVGGATPAARNIVGGHSNAGINVVGCAGLQVLGNFVGLGADGSTLVLNGYGVGLDSCPQSQVGGPTPGARNVISGNTIGCLIGGWGGVKLQGNFIGTDPSGKWRLTNTYGVKLFYSANNLVGGAAAGEGNLISGNSSAVVLEGSSSTNNLIAGNLIGTDITGTNALGNGNYGIIINGSPSNTIGGTTPGARNAIAANDINVGLVSTANNVVQGNFIGTDATGTQGLGVSTFGIYCFEAQANLLGGTTLGAGNVISSNIHGLFLVSGSNNAIQGNFIGTDATGTRGLGNEQYGIYVNVDSPGNLFGGTVPGAGNLVSGNGYDGFQIRAPWTVIEGNIIGTDITGTNALFNGWNAILLNDTAHFSKIGGTNAGARNLGSGTYGLGVLSSSNVIQGNYFGLGADGRTIVGEPAFGVALGALTTGNLLGGDTVGAGNVVSGQSGDGIRVAGSNQVVQGNFIGTDASGTLARGNRNNGLAIFGRNNLIGGSTSRAGNLISGNGATGLDINGNDATENTIQGNFIGTDITGTNALPNGNTGLMIEYAPANLIGGTTPAARNVISGNGGYGLGIAYDGATNNAVQGNYFGLASDGITPLPNYGGVRILGQPGNLIGGTAPGAGNWIVHHLTRGLGLLGDGATNNAILGNHIFANGWLGLDLAEDDVTANDAGDADHGPNLLQNFPEIASAALVSGDLTLRYQVDSAPGNSAYPLTVEFFLADANGQGKTLIGRQTYSTPQTPTTVTFTPLVPVAAGDPITGTATDANGNTSEFSAVATVTANHAPVVASPIPDQSGLYGSAWSYQFPAGSFTDADASDSLSYGASGMPQGVSFDASTRRFAGTPGVAGTFTLTVTATDNGVPPLSVNDTFDLVVAKAALVATADNKSRLAGQANPTLTGTLVGVTNGDVITATFTTTANASSPPGPYLITPLLIDPGGRLPNYAVTTNAGTLTVVDCSALRITNAILPNGVQGVNYNVTLSAINGSAPYVFAVTAGVLPTGLTLSSVGVLSGTPTAAGSSAFTVTSTDVGGCSVSSNYVLVVDGIVYEGFAYPTGDLNGRNGGTGFSGAWAGAAYQVTPPPLSRGGPSSGLSLGAGEGTISRRLTQSLGTVGTTRYLSVLVNIVFGGGFPPPARFGVVLNSTAGTGLFVGRPNSSTTTWVLENAAGGGTVAGPALPGPGLHQLVIKCEFLAGNDRFTLYVDPVPGQPEPATGTVKFNSDAGTVITNLAFTASSTFGLIAFDELRVFPTYAAAVPSCPSIVLSPTTLPGGTISVAYNQTLSAGGGTAPYTFSLASGALPDGLGLSSGGVISGTPTRGGTFSFMVAASDVNSCSGFRSYSINIPCPAMTISPAALPDAAPGVPYSQTLTASGGTAPYTFSVAFGAFPAGITLSSAGVISGTATNYSVSTIGVSATDAVGCATLTNYTYQVAPNRWLGDGAANLWNFTAANWRRGLFHDNEDILFDDTGSNNVPVNIAVPVSPASVSINATQTYVFSGLGGITGTGSLAKANSGELVMAGSNSFSGRVDVLGGWLTVRHNNALGPTSGVTTVGSLASSGNAELHLDGTGLTITEPLTLLVPTFFGNTGYPTNGALVNLAHSNTWSGPITLGTSTVIRSVSGQLTLNSSTPMAGPGGLVTIGDGDVQVQSRLSSTVGFIEAYGPGKLLMTGSNASSSGIRALCNATIMASPAALGLGSVSSSCGVIEIQAGGSASVNNPLFVWQGRLRASGGTVTCGPAVQIDNSGGALATAGPADRLILSAGVRGIAGTVCCGTLSVEGPGAVVLNSGVSLLNGGFGGSWRLADGILQLNHIDAISQRTVTFDGGSLRTGVNAGGQFASDIYVQGDASIVPGRSTSGAGVTNVFGNLTFRSGRLTVAPGANLTAGSSAEVVFPGGSLSTNAVLVVENSGTTNARVNLTGALSDDFFYPPSALIKSGSGTLILAGANTYRGGTVVSNGTLRVANINGSATGTNQLLVLENASLSGTGKISGPVTIKAGGTLTPGTSIGLLSISNSLVLEAGSTNVMEVNLNTRTNDVVAGLTSVTYGGTLVVSNVGAQTFTNGSIFKLFDSASYLGVFTAILPASPGAGLQWDITSLNVNGRLKVISGANHAPVVANPIPDTNALSGIPFVSVFPANAFSDPDPGQELTYTAYGMPPGIGFDPATRTFSGTTTALGIFRVTVIATDNGPSPLSTSDTWTITVIVKPDGPGVIVLTNPMMLPNGAFQFGFSNTPGVPFTALASTNVALPIGEWIILGPVTEVGVGQYQFTDPQAVDAPRRFYNVRSP